VATKRTQNDLGFQLMKIQFFSDVTPFRLVNIHGPFERRILPSSFISSGSELFGLQVYEGTTNFRNVDEFSPLDVA